MYSNWLRCTCGLIAAAFISLASCASIPIPADHQLELVVSPAQSTTVAVLPTDSRLLWKGRLDQSVPSAPRLTWSGSGFTASFEGDMLELRFGGGKGQNHFNVSIDGKTGVCSFPEKGEFSCVIRGLGTGSHIVTVAKRSEASSGSIFFLGMNLPDGKLLEKPRVASRSIEFYGDSITAGACVEDGFFDQWDDRLTHNHNLTYAALTAHALGAEHQTIAVSGIGLVTSYPPFLMKDVWDKVDADPVSARAVPSNPAPEVVFINLGENDATAPFVRGTFFSVHAYSEALVALVQSLRAWYPNAWIVCGLGGMYYGKYDEYLNQALHIATKKLQIKDDKVCEFQFSHVARFHPRVQDQQAMADELVAFIKSITGWN